MAEPWEEIAEQKVTNPWDEITTSNSRAMQDSEIIKQDKAKESSEFGAAFFPRASKAESFGGIIGGGILDIASLPGRLSAADYEAGPENKMRDALKEKIGFSGRQRLMDFILPTRIKEEPEKRGFLESLGDIKGEGLVEQVVRDPATLPSMIPGLGAVSWISKGGKWLPTLAKGSTIAGAEGAISSGIHQAEKVLQGETPSLKEALIETGISAAVPGGLAVAGGGAKLVNYGLGKAASQLSNVSEEALRMWGSGLGKGAKKLKAIHGKQKEIGDRLLDQLDNFEEFMPEKAIVDQALSEMPAIPLDRTIKAIQAEIDKIPANTYKGVRSKLKNFMKDVTGERKLPDVTVKAPAQTTEGKFDIMGQVIEEPQTIPGMTRKLEGDIVYDKDRTAKEFKNLRTFTDKLVNWSTEGANVLNDALKNIRGTMKNELLEVAEKSGNKDYASAMTLWSDKLDKRNALLEVIGKSGKSRKNRIESFLSTIFNKNKETKQKALADIGDIFGEDFLQQSKLLQLSDEMIWEKGGTRILPKPGQATTAIIPGGAQIAAGTYFGSPTAVASGVGTMALSSPMIASKALFTTELAERALKSQMLREASSLGARQKD